MCFSSQADLIGGVVVSAIGVDALRHVGNRRELPIASLPLLLGGHLLVETFVWWGLEGRVPAELGTAAMWIYLLIAFVVLPPYVPLAIMAIEPRPEAARAARPRRAARRGRWSRAADHHAARPGGGAPRSQPPQL